MTVALRWAGQVAAWIVILGAGAAIAIAVVVPRLAGATPYAVLTGSMQPGLPPGSLVVVRPVDPSEIKVGSVITFQQESGSPVVVTHRVVAQGYDGHGEVVLRTKGDANNAPDRDWVLPVQLKGERWYSIPYLGYVNGVLSGAQRQGLVYVGAGLLLGYALWMWIGAVRDRIQRVTP